MNQGYAWFFLVAGAVSCAGFMVACSGSENTSTGSNSASGTSSSESGASSSSASSTTSASSSTSSTTSSTSSTSTGGTTGEAVPYYDMSGKGFGLQGQVAGSPAPGYTAMWGGGIPKQYVYESTVAGGLAGFDVIFPPSYDSSPSKKYPVIYHLHGKGENHTAYRYNGSLDANLPVFWANGTSEFIFISVGGPSDCWWSDGNDGDKAESHIINEVLSVVDQQFRTLGVREGRGIMGFSMGGFGSHKIAIKYPQYFAVGATYCGGTYSAGKYVFSSNEEGFGFGSDFDRIWGTDAEYDSRDCGRALLSSKAAEINQRGTGFVVHAGTTDLFYKHNKGFKTQLDGLGVSSIYTEAGHGHDMGAITAQFFNNILSYMANAQ